MPFTPSVGTFKIFRDREGGDATNVRVPPLFVNTKTLTASTAYGDTVPAGANMVIISASSDIMVNLNGTADTSNHTDGTGSELNPEAYAFNSLTVVPTTISVIGLGTTTPTVTFSYYQI